MYRYTCTKQVEANESAYSLSQNYKSFLSFSLLLCRKIIRMLAVATLSFVLPPISHKMK